MKKRKSAPEHYQPKAKPVEIVLTFSPCLACGKKIEAGYYGRFGDGGVCSKNCNEAQELQITINAARRVC